MRESGVGSLESEVGSRESEGFLEYESQKKGSMLLI